MNSIRDQVHGMWASVADRWGEHADYVEDRGAAVTAAMLDRLALHEGDRVLELACGPGGAGLAAADRVGPSGRVVLSDVAPEMVAIAETRAAATGRRNVETATLDLEDIAQPDEAFDAVLCREGLMFAVDPERAAAEIHRVLRPGGRIAIAVWGPRERNPWLGLVLDAVSEQLGFAVPPPGVPGPFSLEDRDRLAATLGAAGFADVEIEEVAAPVRAHTFEEWWTRTTALAGPIAGILAGLPEEARSAIAGKLRLGVEPYTSAAGLELPGLTLLAIAKR